VTPSASSLIARIDGTPLKGPGGWRVLIATLDASQTPRLLKIIHKRCWAKGRFNYAFVSRSGQLLFRSLVDLALSRATQPDYPTADLGPGLEKIRDQAKTYNAEGDYLDPSLVKLTQIDLEAAEMAESEARTSLYPICTKARQNRKSEHVRKLVNVGVSHQIAERVAESRFDNGFLLGSDIIQFIDGEGVEASILLSSEGKLYDRRDCKDPLDPEYDGGRPVARYYWNGGKNPTIHSFAHGAHTYRLFNDDDTIEAAIRKAGVSADEVTNALANSRLSTICEKQMEKLATKLLGLGNNVNPLREQIARKRRVARDVDAQRQECETDRPDSNTVETDLGKPLPPHSFPIKKETEKGIRILDHADNVRRLLDGYGFTYSYNQITKKIEWHHPKCSQAGDNAENQLYSSLLGLCSLNAVPKDNLDNHLMGLANSRVINPVVDYLKGLQWDGKERFEKLTNAFGSRPNEINSIAARIFMLQACAAADHAVIAISNNPDFNAHFETVVVLVGNQGAGKTKGLQKLLPPALRCYFKESVLLDLKNKDSVKQSCSCWICELGELEGTFKKSDIAALKAHLSQSTDEIRMPYARRASYFDRRTVYVGTVNDRQFLADQTGNRRFIPIDIGTFNLEWTAEEIDQLWAEAWHRYSAGEKWWPTSSEEPLLGENAERFRAKSVIEEKIESEFAWGELPDISAGRKTASTILETLHEPYQADRSAGLLKLISATVRRLWERSDMAKNHEGHLSVQDPDGTWIRLLSENGKNRGWYLPPTNKSKMLNAIAAKRGIV
jgi:hypothetical protein